MKPVERTDEIILDAALFHGFQDREDGTYSCTKEALLRMVREATAQGHRDAAAQLLPLETPANVTLNVETHFKFPDDHPMFTMISAKLGNLTSIPNMFGPEWDANNEKAMKGLAQMGREPGEPGEPEWHIRPATRQEVADYLREQREEDEADRKSRLDFEDPEEPED